MHDDVLLARIQRLNADQPLLWTQTCSIWEESLALYDTIERLHFMPPVMEHRKPPLWPPLRRIHASNKS